MVYLGSIITSDGKSIQEIKQRIALAKTAFSIKHKLFTSKVTPQYQEDLLKHMYGMLKHMDVKHA